MEDYKREGQINIMWLSDSTHKRLITQIQILFECKNIILLWSVLGKNHLNPVRTRNRLNFNPTKNYAEQLC